MRKVSTGPFEERGTIQIDIGSNPNYRFQHSTMVSQHCHSSTRDKIDLLREGFLSKGI